MNKNLKKDLEEAFNLDDLFKVSRARKLVDARTLFFGYRRHIEGIGLEEIGREAGLTHASVVHSLKSFDYVSETLYPNEWHHILSNGLDDNISTFTFMKEIESLKSKINNLEEFSKPLKEAEDNGILDYVLEKLDIIIKVKLKTK